MTTTSNRRRWLHLCGTGAVLSLTGCLGNGDDDGTGDTDDDDTGDPTGSGTGPTGDGGVDDTEVGEIEEIDEDLTAADILEEDEVDAFIAEIRIAGYGQATQRVHDGEIHLTVQTEGFEVEYFVFDDREYEVTDGSCGVHETDESVEADWLVPVEPFRGSDLEQHVVSGTTTVDGEPVYVVDSQVYRTFISQETGYRVREEWGDSAGDLHSWGATDPITPPDMDCEPEGDFDPDEDSDEDGDDEEPDTQTLGDVISDDLADVTSYRVDSEFKSPAEGSVVERVHGEDRYQDYSVSAGGDAVEGEHYVVDGTIYSIIDGECFILEDDPEPVDAVDPQEELDEGLASLPVEGTTTVEGEEVYIFEDSMATYYVSRTTGFPVRFEYDEFVADIHSWDEVDPITPPDMECTDTT